MRPRTIIIATMIFLNACGAHHMSLLKKGEIKKYQTIAVDTFSSPDATSGGTASDMVAEVLMRKGYNVIERSQLQAILKEQKLSHSGILKPESMKQLGEVYGVNGIVTGTVGDFNTNYVASLFNNTPYSSGSLTIKLVDVETARLLWTGNRSARGMNMSYHKVMEKNLRKIMKKFPKAEVNQ